MMPYLIDKILNYKTYSIRRKINSLLEMDANIYCNLGIDSTKTVTIAKGNFDKVSLNYEHIYPEYNSLDNWRNIHKSFLNKPIQFRFLKDIQDHTGGRQLSRFR